MSIVQERVPTVGKAVAVLRVLAENGSPVPAAALIRRLGLPRSSTFQLLKELTEEGLVTHVPESHGYMLGGVLSELASAFSRRALLQNLAKPLLATLASTVRGTASLSILHDEHVIVLHEENVTARPLDGRPQRSLAPHLSAAGRALIAALPQNELEHYLQHLIVPEPAPTQAELVQQLRTRLRDDTRRGWTSQRHEPRPDVTSVAACVRDRSGRVVASISASVPDRIAAAGVTRVAELVQRSARGMTYRLGGGEGGAAQPRNA